MRLNHNTFDSALTAPHYSTRIYKGLLIYLQRTLGLENAKELVRQTGLDWNYLSKETNWVSETFAERFYDVVSGVNGVGADFSYEAGRIAMSPDVQGPVHALAMQLLDPSNLFKKIVYFARRFNTVDSLDIISLSSNTIVLKFESRRPTKHLDLVIDNWRGFLEQVPAIQGLAPAQFVVKEKFDKAAIFHVTWASNSLFKWLCRLRIAFLALSIVGAIPFLVILAAPSFLLFNSWKMISLTLGGTSACLSFTLYIEHMRRNLVGTAGSKLTTMLHESEDRYHELYQNKSLLDRKYKEMELLNGAISRINASFTTTELTEKTVTELQKSLHYDRVIFMAYDKLSNSLRASSNCGFDPESRKQLNDYSIDLNTKTTNDVHLGNVFKNRKAILVPVTPDYFGTLSEEGRLMLFLTKSACFLAVSVATEEAGFGVLLVDNVSKEKSLSSDDIRIVQSISNQLAIGLSKAEALETEHRLRTSFQKFVPPQVVNSILGEGDPDVQHGVKQNVTVLFSDLRGFTDWSSKTEPDLLIRALNYYLQEMTHIVYASGGIVDKFIGDGVLALFNAFGTSNNHAERALEAAEKMRLKLPEVNAWIENNIFIGKTFEPFSASIAIYSGEVIVGNLGTDHKTEFTAIGETVNIAARLVEIGKKYPSPIIISETLEPIARIHYETQSIGSFSIRGANRELTLCLVGSAKNGSSESNEEDVGFRLAV